MAWRRLGGCATASAIRSPASPTALPSANVPSLRLACGEPGTGEHGRKDDLSEALAVLCPIDEYQRLLVAGDRPTIVPLGLIDTTERLGHQGLAGRYPRQRWRVPGHAGIQQWPGHGHSRSGIGAPASARLHPSRRGSSRATARVSASRSNARIRRKSPRDMSAVAQGEPEVNGLLEGVALLRQMLEGPDRLLEVPHGLTVRGPR